MGTSWVDRMVLTLLPDDTEEPEELLEPLDLREPEDLVERAMVAGVKAVSSFLGANRNGARVGEKTRTSGGGLFRVRSGQIEGGKGECDLARAILERVPTLQRWDDSEAFRILPAELGK